MPGKVASMLLGVLNSVESPKVRWPRGCFVDKMIAWIPGDTYVWTQTCVKKKHAHKSCVRIPARGRVFGLPSPCVSIFMDVYMQIKEALA